MHAAGMAANKVAKKFTVIYAPYMPVRDATRPEHIAHSTVYRLEAAKPVTGIMCVIIMAVIGKKRC